MLALLLMAADLPPVPLTEADRTVIRKAVGDKLMDGESARFRWPAPTKWGIYCGWVNAKNSFGAYVGFRPYVVLGGRGAKGPFRADTINVSTDSPEDIDTQIVNKMCTDNGYDLSTLPPE